MTYLFVVLAVALSGLVVALLDGNWPCAGLCAGLTLLSATFLVADERRRL